MEELTPENAELLQRIKEILPPFKKMLEAEATESEEGPAERPDSI